MTNERPDPQLLLAVRASRSLLASVQRPAIVISAEPIGWNDFNYKFRVKAHLLGVDEDEVVDHLFMVEDNRDTLDAFKSLGAGEGLLPLSDVGALFCSLFAEEKSYPTLVRLFGYEAARQALIELSDAGLLDRQSEEPAQRLLSTEAFHLGVLRDPTAYSAFRRGAAALKVHERVAIADAASSFRVTATLPPRWRDATVDFDFETDEFLRDRFVVLIGANGTGKTTLLLSLIRTILAGQAIPDDTDYAIIDQIPAVNGIIAFSTSPSDRYSALDQAADGPDYEHFQLIEPPRGDFDPLTLAIVDLFRQPAVPFAPESGTETRRALLEELLNPLALWDHIHLPVIAGKERGIRTRTVEDVSYMPLSAFRGGEKKVLTATMAADISKRPVLISRFGIRSLSSGELAMFRFAVQIVSAIEPGCLIILDEPETHLHPKFISDLMEMLDRLLKSTRSVAIIATHSPFVVREAPRRRVRVLGIEDGTAVALKPRLQTFGASIDSIADAVFGDSERIHLHERLLERWVEEQGRPSVASIIKKYGSELNSETLSFLAEKIDGDHE